MRAPDAPPVPDGALRPPGWAAGPQSCGRRRSRGPGMLAAARGAALWLLLLAGVPPASAQHFRWVGVGVYVCVCARARANTHEHVGVRNVRACVSG